MKQFFLIVTFLLGTFVFSNAQTKSKNDSVKAANKAAGLNKNGTPDMRLKANKEAAKAKQNVQLAPAPAASVPAPSASAARVTTQAPIAVAPKVTTQNQTRTAPSTSTSNKVFGTDAKGRTIYEGSRGGHYIINSKGNKEYIKK